MKEPLLVLPDEWSNQCTATVVFYHLISRKLDFYLQTASNSTKAAVWRHGKKIKDLAVMLSCWISMHTCALSGHHVGDNQGPIVYVLVSSELV